MTTDKELLELAAKAAGIEIYTRVGNTILYKIGKYLGHWNPLTSNDDALRLAVKLSIHILQYGTVTTAKHVDSTICFDERGDGQSDKTQEAATRRAIVRAAAEIGKSA